jgi:hypothetical protein
MKGCISIMNIKNISLSAFLLVISTARLHTMQEPTTLTSAIENRNCKAEALTKKKEYTEWKKAEELYEKNASPQTSLLLQIAWTTIKQTTEYKEWMLTRIAADELKK